MMADKVSGMRFCSHLSKTTTKDVVIVLEGWFFTVGVPSRIHTDGSPQFRTDFGNWCLDLGVNHKLSSAYHQEWNRLSEACVQVIKDAMKKLGVVKGPELEKLIFKLKFKYDFSILGCVTGRIIL